MYVHKHAHATYMHMKVRAQPVGVALTFYQVDPRDQTLAVRLSSKYRHPLSHLTNPHPKLKKEFMCMGILPAVFNRIPII